MACIYFYADRQFNGLDNLKKFLSTQGYVLDEYGKIDQIITYSPRKLTDLVKTYGSIDTYKRARSAFARIVEIQMYPKFNSARYKSPAAAVIKVSADGYPITNISLTRQEAIAEAYRFFYINHNEILRKVDENISLTDKEKENADFYAKMADVRVFTSLVKDFYPDVTITAKKKGTFDVLKKESPIDVKLAVVKKEDIYNRDSSTDLTKNLQDEEGTPDQNYDAGTEVQRGNEGWSDDADSINPLRKASDAVKQMMNNIFIGRDNPANAAQVSPNYVFYKCLENITGIDTADIAKPSIKEEIAQIKRNFESNGMIKYVDAAVEGGKIRPPDVGAQSYDKDYQIYRRIRDLLELSDNSIYYDHENRPQRIPSTIKMEWVGDNQRGYYHVINEETKMIVELRDPDTGQPLSVKESYRVIKDVTGLPYEGVQVLYESYEAAETVNSLYFVINSHRAKNPVFCEYAYNSYHGEKGPAGAKTQILRFFKNFKNESQLSSIKARLENAIIANQRALLEFRGTIANVKESNYNEKAKVVELLLYDVLRVAPPAKKEKDDVYGGQMFLTEAAVDELLATFDGLISSLDRIDTAKDGQMDDMGQELLVSPEEVLKDQRNYINVITNACAKAQKAGRSSSYTGGDGKQRWFHMYSNQAIDTIQKIMKGETPRTFLRTPFFSYNIFNPVRGKQILNKIHKIYDYDSITAEEKKANGPKAVTYRREDDLSWIERNFFYSFNSFLTFYKAEGTRYVQQFYTISDKPNMLGAEINVLKPDQLKAAIKEAITQELNRDLDGKKSKTLAVYKKGESFLGYGGDLRAPDAVEKVYESLTTLADASLEVFLSMNPMVERSFADTFNKLRREGYFESKTVIDRTSLDLFYKNQKVDVAADTRQGQLARAYLGPVHQLYFMNYFVNSYFLNQLVAGDQAQFKDAYDQTKRMSMVFAIGQKGRVNEKRGLRKFYNTLVLNDITPADLESTGQGTMYDTYRQLLERKYDITDAQGLTTPERMENVRRGLSREANIGAPAKPVYFGIDDNGIARGIKYSTIELTNEACVAFPEWAEMRFDMTFSRADYTDEALKYTRRDGVVLDIPTLDDMRDLFNLYISDNLFGEDLFRYRQYVNTIINQGNHIDEVVFGSAFKVGKPSATAKFDKVKGKFDMSTAEIIPLLNSNYRHQLNPRHDADSKTANMTQPTYQLNTNGKNFLRSAKVLNLNALIHNIGMKKMMREFTDENGNVGPAQIKLIRTRIKETLSKVAGNERMIEMLDDKQISMNLPFIVNKLQQALIASFSKATVEIKHKGSKLVLQSSVGTGNTTARILGGKEPPRLIFEKGRYYMECYLPEAIFRNLMMKGGLTEDQILKDPLYSQLLGFRIPATELHSMVPLKIVGWYPNKYGDNIIICPKELVLLHGSDFDIDSLYTVNNFVAEEDLQSLDGNQIAYKGAAVGYHHVDGKAEPLPFLKGVAFTDYLLGELEKYKEGVATDEATIKRNREYVSKVEDLITQAASNEILATFLETIQADENLPDMMTPISMAVFNDLDNDSSVFSYLVSLKARLLPEAKRKTILSKKADGTRTDEGEAEAMKLIRPPRNLNHMDDQRAMHQDNFRAKALTGAIANAFKVTAYLFMGTNNFTDGKSKAESDQELPQLRSKYHLTFDSDTYKSFNRYVQVNGELQDGSEVKDEEGKTVLADDGTPLKRPRVTIWQNIDALLNGAIDHVKEQILNVINVTEKTGNVFVVMTAMGIPVDKVSLFMTQPAILEISNRARSRSAVQDIKSELKNSILEKIKETKDPEHLAKIAAIDAKVGDAATKEAEKQKVWDQIFQDVVGLTYDEALDNAEDEVDEETNAEEGQAEEAEESPTESEGITPAGEKDEKVEETVKKKRRKLKPKPFLTSELENGYLKKYGDYKSYSVDELIFQHRTIRQFERLQIIGDDYIFQGSTALRSVQQLPGTFPDLQNILKAYDQFFNVNEFLAASDITQTGKVPKKSPFKNVNLSRVPNIQSSVKVVSDLVDLLGDVFPRDNGNFVAMSRAVEAQLSASGVIEMMAPDGQTDENVQENNQPVDKTSKGFLDFDKNKSLSQIRDNFIEYLLSGIFYINGAVMYNMSVEGVPSYITINKGKKQKGQEAKTFEKEFNGTAAWIARFIYDGFESPLGVYMPNGLRLKSFQKIQEQYGANGNNMLLQQLAINTDSETKLPYITFALGKLDALDKLDYEAAFVALKDPNIKIYEDNDGNDDLDLSEIFPMLTRDGVYNEFQHALLKYAVLNQGLAFGAQNYSSMMEPGIFRGISKQLDIHLKNLFVTGKLKIEAAMENFLLQMALMKVKNLPSIYKLAERETEARGYKVKKTDGTETVFGVNKGAIKVGREKLGDVTVYYDAKVKYPDQKKAPRFVSTGTFGGSGGTAYVLTHWENEYAYYQKIERLDSSKAFSFDPTLLNRRKENWYKIGTHFAKDMLALNYRSLNPVEGKPNHFTMHTKYVYDPMIASIEDGDVIHLFDKANYSRLDIEFSRYEVVSKTIGENGVFTLTVKKTSPNKSDDITDEDMQQYYDFYEIESDLEGIPIQRSCAI